MTQEEITRRQRAIGPRPVTPRTRRDFRAKARWWLLEAMRGYPCSHRSLQYAANMRRLVELMDNGVDVVGRPLYVLEREQLQRAKVLTRKRTPCTNVE